MQYADARIGAPAPSRKILPSLYVCFETLNEIWALNISLRIFLACSGVVDAAGWRSDEIGWWDTLLPGDYFISPFSIFADPPDSFVMIVVFAESAQATIGNKAVKTKDTFFENLVEYSAII